MLEGACVGSLSCGGAGWLQPASATQRVSAKKLQVFSSVFLLVLNKVFQHLRYLRAGGLPLGA